MKSIVNLTPEAEALEEVVENEIHNIKSHVNANNKDIYLECASREALYELGKALMLEALHGSGQMELYPLGFKGKWLAVNGVRLTEDSSRIFIFSPSQNAG